MKTIKFISFLQAILTGDIISSVFCQGCKNPDSNQKSQFDFRGLIADAKYCERLTARLKSLVWIYNSIDTLLST